MVNLFPQPGTKERSDRLDLAKNTLKVGKA